jgi:hypothetical protein
LQNCRKTEVTTWKKSDHKNKPINDSDDRINRLKTLNNFCFWEDDALFHVPLAIHYLNP